MASISVQGNQEASNNFLVGVTHLLEEFGFVRRQSTSDRPGNQPFYLSTFVGEDGVVVISVYNGQFGIEFDRIIHGPIKNNIYVLSQIDKLACVHLSNPTSCESQTTS